jgi:hypothetical protein
MNGRMYDPSVGRFLSPDKVVQAPDFTQSYNRYSYCFNNPISYIDATGQSSFNVVRPNDKGEWIVTTIQIDDEDFGKKMQHEMEEMQSEYAKFMAEYQTWKDAIWLVNNTIDFKINGVSQGRYVLSPYGYKTGHWDKNGDFVEIKNTVVGYNFVESAASGGGISIDPAVGGFISTKEAFTTFMYDQAKNNPIEVAAFELNNSIYWVQPWNLNSATMSINNIDGIPGFPRGEVIAQYHTHPNSSGPSYFDAQFSASYGKTVYTMGADGSLWYVSYQRGDMVPLYGTITNGQYYGYPYGSKIH